MTINELANTFSAEDGDPLVIKRVVAKAKPYIKKIIHKLDTPSGLEYSQQDLEQTASLIVVKALRNYDSASDAKFSTYMYFKVYKGLISYMRKHDTLTRTQRNKAGEVREAIHILSQELGREPSEREIGYHIGHSEDEVRSIKCHMNSRNKESGDEGDSAIRELAGEVEQEARISADLSKKLSSLDVRSRVILLLAFFHDLTTKQVSRIIDLSPSYVSNLKHKAIRSLRE